MSSTMSLSKSSSKLLSPRPSKKEKDSIPNQTDINNLATETPVLKGYMYKKSHSFDSFNKRYFALYTGCIVYYRKEDEYKKDLGNQTLKVRIILCGIIDPFRLSLCNVFVCVFLVSFPYKGWEYYVARVILQSVTSCPLFLCTLIKTLTSERKPSLSCIVSE